MGTPRGRGVGGIRGVGGEGCIGVASGIGAQPHWAPVQGPSTPTNSPEGVTSLAKAKQVMEMSSAGYYIHLGTIFCDSFHILYLCHIITYFYMQYKEMLYRLFSLQTSLCISFHHQSDIL